MALVIGGTQSGGVSTVLTPAGHDASGRIRFALPTHTALNQRIITVGASNGAPTKQDLGFAGGTVDVAFANAASGAECCTVQLGGVYINLKVRRALNQPDSVVDDAVATLQGVAFAQFLKDLMKMGLVTAS